MQQINIIDKYRRESERESAKYPDLLANPKKKGLDDDYDAFRHIYSSAAVTYDYISGAAWLADLREYFSKSNSPDQVRMDLHNNKLGREIGSQVLSRDDISVHVYNAIKSDKHIRITPPQEATSTDDDNYKKDALEQGQYIWRTVGDSDVRTSHSMREGKIFSWDNPPEGGHPGEDYGCRCEAEPYPNENTPYLEKVLYR